QPPRVLSLRLSYLALPFHLLRLRRPPRSTLFPSTTLLRSQVRTPAVRARIPDALFRIDVVVTLVRVLVEPYRVEDVELGLGPVVRGRRDARLYEMLFGLLRHVALAAGLARPRHRVHHRARGC